MVISRWKSSQTSFQKAVMAENRFEADMDITLQQQEEHHGNYNSFQK